MNLTSQNVYFQKKTNTGTISVVLVLRSFRNYFNLFLFIFFVLSRLLESDARFWFHLGVAWSRLWLVSIVNHHLWIAWHFSRERGWLAYLKEINILFVCLFVLRVPSNSTPNLNVILTRGGRNIENQNVERSERRKYLLGWSERQKIRTSKDQNVKNQNVEKNIKSQKWLTTFWSSLTP